MLFTFALAVAGLMLLENRGLAQQALGFALILVVAELLGVDYGAYGVTMVLAFYYLRDNPLLASAAVGILSIGYDLAYNPFVPQAFCLLALPLIYLVRLPRLQINKYAFYVFYPAHILVLWVISRTVPGL